MAKWILYILECADGSLYTGITTDLDKRLKKHNQGKACKYTRARKPVNVVYRKIFNSESLARKREIEVKKLSRINKLRLIKLSSLAAQSKNRAARDQILRSKI